MSDILIKGMEMPTSCTVCPMLEGGRMDGLCHAACKWLDDGEYWTWYVYREGDIDYSKPCNCPLVSIPPHGRLIDADALDTEILQAGFSYALTRRKLRYTPGDVRQKIANAPTIIPAEESES